MRLALAIDRSPFSYDGAHPATYGFATREVQLLATLD